MGETRVDLLHLLEDLRDAYPGSAEETILTETVANSLDSGAATIALVADPAQAMLTIVDDGEGMRRRELARYHDVAASTKGRGEGIGFAGVGIKIALLVAAEVLTETRRGKHHVASVWRLASRHRAPWRWVEPSGLVADRGTAVRLKLDNTLSPLLDPGFVEATLRRHFQPFFEPALAEVLATHYRRGVRFLLNGRGLAPEPWRAPEVAPVAVRVGRRRKPSVEGFLVRDAVPLPEDRRGVAISTFGKVIRRGWEWLGVTPVTPDRIGGLVEAPPLAECLTLNKADFIRAAARGATYLAYRKAIQEVVARQLGVWGDGPEGAEPRRASRPLERDLESVVLDLADRFPLLATLVEQRAGGQRKLPIGRPGASDRPGAGTPLTPVPGPVDAQGPRAGGPGDAGPGRPADGGEAAEPDQAGMSAAQDRVHQPDAPGGAAGGPGEARLPERGRARIHGRYGLGIQFESRPDDPEPARLVESTVWVNEAHPAYRRAAASRSEGYHIALASALALAPLAVEPAKEHAFVTAFLGSWGSALDRRQRRPRRRLPL